MHKTNDENSGGFMPPLQKISCFRPRLAAGDGGLSGHLLTDVAQSSPSAAFCKFTSQTLSEIKLGREKR
jgi:hypothetical protein